VIKLTAASVLALLFVNLIPLVGVLFLDWDLYSIMVLYWLENLVIGGFNIIKMTFAAKADSSLSQKLFSIPFFTFHYGFFCFVHGIFVMVLFQPGGLFATSFSPFDLFSLSFMQSLARAFNWALLALVLSHGLSLVSNYFLAQEYLTVSVQEQLFQPYRRIIILHMTILVGGFVTMILGAPIFALVFMVILKTVMDVRAHQQEHQLLRPRSAANS
jgi:hypothetical protein